eukprot:SAG31_NODE_7465_length_1682_cov_1.409349_3_plen_288_part_01
MQKIRIRDLACSPEFAELSELQQTAFGEHHYEQEDLGPSYGGNWFSPLFAKELYRYYLQLDADCNGMLSKDELRQFGRYCEDGTAMVFPVPACSLTDVFVDRVFEECPLYDGEMDFKTFVEFTLAFVYKHTPEALSYFFQLLDVEHTGKLTGFCINFFFREVLAGIQGPATAAEHVMDLSQQEQAFDGTSRHPEQALQTSAMLYSEQNHEVTSARLADSTSEGDSREAAVLQQSVASRRELSEKTTLATASLPLLTVPSQVRNPTIDEIGDAIDEMTEILEQDAAVKT